MMAPPPPPAATTPPTPEQRQLQQAAQNVTNELMQAKMLRAALSERQLEEVLVDFWFNHFNVFVGKGQVRQYLTEYERDAIRPHVLGNFRDDARRDGAQPGDALLSRQLPEPDAERAAQARGPEQLQRRARRSAPRRPSSGGSSMQRHAGRCSRSRSRAAAAA